MQELYPELSLDEREQIRLSYAEHFVRVDQTLSPFFDGVEEGLLQLKQTVYKMAVATGKSWRGLNRVLERLDMKGFFDATRCADDILSKLHPLMLQEFLEHFRSRVIRR